MNPDIIGWAASALLLATVIQQVLKQWQSSSSDGVSSWLFLGQMAASLGFLIYAWMLGNPVFILTNAALLVAAVLGQYLYLRNKRRSRSAAG